MSRIPSLTPASEFPLNKQIENLSLEAGLVGNVVASFSNTLPYLDELLKNSLAKLVESSNETADLAAQVEKDSVKVFGNRGQLSYMDYVDTLVPVPEGFQGNLPDYIKTLSDLSQTILHEAIVEVESYNTVLAQFVGSRDGKITIRDHTDIAKRLELTQKKAAKILEPYQDPKKDLAKRPLGSVIYNFDDIDRLGRYTRLLGQDFKTFKIKDFAAVVQRTDNYLDLLLKEAKNGNITRVSGPTAMNISVGARAVADYVGFVSVFRFKMEQAIVAASKVVKTFS